MYWYLLFTFQTSDPVINTENDEKLILKLDSNLQDNGIGG